MARFVLTTNLKLLVANTLGKCVAMRHVKLRKINLILVLTKIGDVYMTRDNAKRLRIISGLVGMNTSEHFRYRRQRNYNGYCFILTTVVSGGALTLPSICE